MKKIILGMLVLGAIAGTSCKKDKNNGSSSCDKTVAGIANTFKFSKQTAQSSAGGGEVSTTSDACQQSGVYVLKADKTATYTESGSSCGGTETGNWDVISGKLHVTVGDLQLQDMDINTWDCTNLTVGFATTVGPYTLTTKWYLVKQ